MIRMRITVLLLLTSAAGAQDSRVYATVFSSGAFIVGAANAQTGIFFKDAGGDDTTWAHTGPQRTRANGVAVDPASVGRRMYLAAGNGLLRTTDAGASWRVTTDWRVKEVLGVSLHPLDGSTLYIATAYGIWRSSDAGGRWEPRNTGRVRPLFTSSVIVDHADPRIVYCSAEDGVYASPDEGRHWRRLPLGEVRARTVRQHPRHASVLAAGLEDGGVRISTDGGRTWSAAGEGIAGLTVYALAFDPEDSRILYAGGFGFGVMKTSDQGLTWTPAWEGQSRAHVHALAVDPRRSSRLYAGTIGAGVFRSDDGARSWDYAGLGFGQVGAIAIAPMERAR